MRSLDSPLMELYEYDNIRKDIANGNTPVLVTGCTNCEKAHIMSSFGDLSKQKIVITYSEIRARELLQDYSFFTDNVYYYPAKDLIFYSADIHGNLIVNERMDVIKHLFEDDEITVIMTVDALFDRLLPPDKIKENIITIENDAEIDLDKLKDTLVMLGYERTLQIEGKGQFAIRGGIIDIYPLTQDAPVRIELWDTVVDSIRSFDIDSQRSVENMDELKIYPAREIILTDKETKSGIAKIKKEMESYSKTLLKEDRLEESHRIKTIIQEFIENLEECESGMALEGYIQYFYKDTVSFLDYFYKDSLIIIDEPQNVREKCENTQEEFRESMVGRIEKGYILPGQSDMIYNSKEILARLAGAKKEVAFATFTPKLDYIHVKNERFIDVRNINSYNNSFELLVKDLKKYVEEKYKLALLSGSRTRAERLAGDLREFGLNAVYSDKYDEKLKPGEIRVYYGNLRRGFEYPSIKFAIITESDIFGAKEKKKRKKTRYEGKKIQSFTDLNIGDYVVHENHGLGIYRGIEKVEVDKVTKDYIKIEYAGSGNLYVPATGLDVIMKYAGSDAKKPKLNKLGTKEWINTKTKVKGAVKEIAKELVELYAKRQNTEGYMYGPDTVWQTEFEEMFPYEETQDQLLAIEATKKDMESHKVMDRLICGDVGYGKTEIAIRAAFKAVQEGKQVVYLVPTTILAKQHFTNFEQRMKDYPVKVELLCRFRTPAQNKKTIEELKKGMVDIVIGTHRILSKDVKFKDLGLLIIDEEQRFGVAHKEKIKQMKENIDVLTLTATPIPRTLHMSLIGIRDMSVLEEPPIDRLPIQTFVTEYNEEMVREAINRELARGGQVYYVYNRVNDIDEVTTRVAKLVPEATVSFIHGQMSEREVEKIMYDFINGDIDVLVATTIIETGLDISNVNTMIIHDADQLGLSQLYQLRGRVGRSNRTSYAFLMYRRNKMLKEVAEKRLHAIREFTELGSGFKIAMKDLEIRGAGNLLGAEQHGHMEAVGYDLYCKMLNEAVNAAKGKEEEEDYETSIDIDVDAYIPATYIKSEMQKLDVYKRIAAITTEEELMDIQDELIDRFGEPPRSAVNLINVAFLKSMAHEGYIEDVKGNRAELTLKMYKKARVNTELISTLVNNYGRNLRVIPGEEPVFVYKFKKEDVKDNDTYMDTVKRVLTDICSLRIK